jgi:subtilisin family serine protease
MTLSSPSIQENAMNEQLEPFTFVIGLIGESTVDMMGYLTSQWTQQYGFTHNVTFTPVTSLHFIVAEVAADWTIDQVTSLIRTLARKPQVYWMSQKSRHIKANYFAAGIGESGRQLERSINEQGLTGKGVQISSVDTGITVTHSFFSSMNNSPPVYMLNTDLVSKDQVPKTDHKISLYLYWNESDIIDSLEGHGTHVAGTLAGLPDPGAITYPYRGIAYDAQLVFFDINNEEVESEVLHIPLDMINELYGKIYMTGARISSNSWGSLNQGYTMTSSVQVDAFMYNNPDFLLVFAAGNEGQLGISTISEPASAKNVLAVGATISSKGPMIFLSTSNGLEINGTVMASAFGSPIAYNSISGTLVTLDDIDVCTKVPPPALVANKVVIFKLIPQWCDDPVQIAKNVQKSGAIGLMIVTSDDYNHVVIMPKPNSDASSITIPVFGLPYVAYSANNYYFHDGTSIRIQQTDNYINDVPFFSSRGPTFDHRIKPDILAPGMWLMSSLSAPNYLFQNGLYAMQGTSHPTIFPRWILSFGYCQSKQCDQSIRPSSESNDH